MRKIPSKIFFFCHTPPPEGGQTSLARSDILLREMERRQPEFVSKVSQLGVKVEVVYPKEHTTQLITGNSWKTLLGTNDPSEAKKRAMDSMLCSSLEYTNDEGAKITFGPLDIVRTLQGKKLWFSTIDGEFVKLGDESSIPEEVVESYKVAIDEISVDIKWQKGDILVVNNLSTQHARKPGKAPRRIYVSLCK